MDEDRVLRILDRLEEARRRGLISEELYQERKRILLSKYLELSGGEIQEAYESRQGGGKRWLIAFIIIGIIIIGIVSMIVVPHLIKLPTYTTIVTIHKTLTEHETLTKTQLATLTQPMTKILTTTLSSIYTTFTTVTTTIMSTESMTTTVTESVTTFATVTKTVTTTQGLSGKEILRLSGESSTNSPPFTPQTNILKITVESVRTESFITWFSITLKRADTGASIEYMSPKEGKYETYVYDITPGKNYYLEISSGGYRWKIVVEDVGEIASQS